MIEDNPFYYNYVFSGKDIERAIIKRWEYPFLWLLRTYVQCHDGYAWFYKRWKGKIFLMKYELLPTQRREADAQKP